MALLSAALPILRLRQMDIATALSGRELMLRQIFIVSAINFRSLKQRPWASLVVVVGMACVIGVLLSMLSLTEGMLAAYDKTGDPGRALVVSTGALGEGNSNIPRDKARLIMDAPGIAKAPDGSPLADAGMNTGVPVYRLNGRQAYNNLRGFGPKGVMLRPEFHIVSGRMFRPGTRELIVGVAAKTQFKGMTVGDKVILPDGEWPIVGSYHHRRPAGWPVGRRYRDRDEGGAQDGL